jgi:hypothetical protein
MKKYIKQKYERHEIDTTLLLALSQQKAASRIASCSNYGIGTDLINQRHLLFRSRLNKI